MAVHSILDKKNKIFKHFSMTAFFVHTTSLSSIIFDNSTVCKIDVFPLRFDFAADLALASFLINREGDNERCRNLWRSSGEIRSSATTGILAELISLVSDT